MRRSRRRLPSTRALASPGSLGELDDDAERLLGVKEGLLPVRVRVVVADDRVAVRLGPLAGLAQARHPEGHVVDERAVPGQEAVQEAILAQRLEDLEAPAAVDAPLTEAIGPGWRPASGIAAHLSH